MIRLGILYRFGFNSEVKLTIPQLALKEKLDLLNTKLCKNTPEKRIFGFFKKQPENKVKEIYIYGGVGQGKTMLMDMFYENLKVSKTRVHFHEFMIEIQKRLHEIKNSHSNHLKESKTNGNNDSAKEKALELVCQDIVSKSKVLCLDEFHVTHISDAMILKELFTNLFRMGLVLVCTSNRPPEELYKNGLNRDRFLPFIPILKKYCEVFNLNSEDFRQKMVSEELVGQVFFVGKSLNSFLEEYLEQVKVNRSEIRERRVKITLTRSVRVPYCHDKVAFFEFWDFCSHGQGSLGTDAYIEIANNFHTLYLANVPNFDTNVQNNNSLRVFIHLIDVLYEKNTKLFLSTEGPLIYIFGLYGIVKLFDKFYNTVKDRNLEFGKEVMELGDFVEKTKEYGLTKSESSKLFTALLSPEEEVLSMERLQNILNTHRQLKEGKYPRDFVLYRFDTYEENVNEDEFQCSRTLSRLFHMSSKNYLETHKELYG